MTPVRLTLALGMACLLLAGCSDPASRRSLEEPNDTREDAWSDDGQIPHFFDSPFTLPAGDVDWFWIRAAPGQRFFDINVYSEEGRVRLRIEDTQGTLLADLVGSGDGPETSGVGCDLRAEPEVRYFFRITPEDAVRKPYSIHVYDPETLTPFYEQKYDAYSCEQSRS